MNASDIQEGTVVEVVEDTKTTTGLLKKGTKLVAEDAPVGSGWFYARVKGKKRGRHQLNADWVKKA